ncbi:hypothetical protein [Lewinella sp. JB7]|uniref:hypothetical protein n=1 Tax=Lewinella sp. JB7 TaxID=2962887 RepID=UPI0020C9A286|nr:hypothetical protein [Lewinella sp. JB7]MCP9235208.1 hypothetical protein [Lewinella sp. JB7]
MKFVYIYLCLSCLILCACEDEIAEGRALWDQTVTSRVDGQEPAMADVDPEFLETLDAHGGLGRWRAFTAVSFLLRDFPTGDGERTLADFHRVDLRTRNQNIEGENYRIVSRGDSTWISPGVAVTGIPPRMYNNASFYLFGMPFVFGDPGLSVEHAGTTTFRSETLEQFDVTVPDDTGDGGNDYRIYVDPQTHQLRYGAWTVSYPAVADLELHQVARFDDWQTVNGMLVPAAITLFTKEGEEPTADTPGAPIYFERVAFSDRAFSASIFERPPGTVADRSHLR